MERTVKDLGDILTIRSKKYEITLSEGSVLALKDGREFVWEALGWTLYTPVDGGRDVDLLTPKEQEMIPYWAERALYETGGYYAKCRQTLRKAKSHDPEPNQGDNMNYKTRLFMDRDEAISSAQEWAEGEMEAYKDMRQSTKQYGRDGVIRGTAFRIVKATLGRYLENPKEII